MYVIQKLTQTKSCIRSIAHQHFVLQFIHKEAIQIQFSLTLIQGEVLYMTYGLIANHFAFLIQENSQIQQNSNDDKIVVCDIYEQNQTFIQEHYNKKENQSDNYPQKG